MGGLALKTYNVTQEEKDAIVYLYLHAPDKPTLDQVAREMDRSLHRTIVPVLKEYLGEEEFKKQKALRYSRSRRDTLKKRPDKCGTESPRYMGAVLDGNGYLLILKPEWYTGKQGSKHIFLHHKVFCEATGMTEIPPGFVVHHVDGDRMNNSIDNLALLSASAHQKMHCAIRRSV